MRISVECGGYAEAAGVCRTANHVAALVTESLAGKLGAYAGMAGDDATSSDFAASYDPAAREAVAALADLTHALIGLGRLVDASGRSHARAEAGAAGVATTTYVGAGLDEDSYVRVSPAPPPSSIGGGVASGLGDIQAWILDQVEGFLWPGADVELLRDAAASWRRTSVSVADLAGHLDAVTRLLERQRSPEVPLREGSPGRKPHTVNHDRVPVTELVDELEDDLRTDGILCLYQFSWFQDIGGRPDDRSEIARLSRAAYDELVRRRPDLRLVWVTWPDLTPSAAKPADADTELDFFLDSDAKTNDPLLALVASSDLVG